MIRRWKKQRSEKHNQKGQSKKVFPTERLLLINCYEIRDPTQKLPIRPMLMRGRAQAFCFDESARGSRLSGMSVSSRKNWYSHLPPGCLAGHLQEFLQVVFDASESSDSYEEVLPASMACPLIRCVHVTGREAGASSGPLSSLCLYNPFKGGQFS